MYKQHQLIIETLQNTKEKKIILLQSHLTEDNDYGAFGLISSSFLCWFNLLTGV